MRGRRLVWLIVLTAIIVRLALIIWAGNAAETPLTGGSDTLAYQTLAENIAHHHGMTYAGFPTAIRAPMYPMFLALLQLIAGGHYRLLARLIQFLVGIAIAIVCAKSSERLEGVGLIAFAATLAFPTQVFFQAELLTETFATLIVAAFLYAVLKSTSSVAIGAIIGLGMLARFNLTDLAVVYVVYELLVNRSQAAQNIPRAALVAFLIVSPWFVRNLVVFDRAVLYSTDSGMTLLSGVVDPDGRTTGADWDRLASRAGWTTLDIETNSVTRQGFPAEPQLDQQAMRAAMTELARRPLTDLMFLAIRKLSFFWLSTDQAFLTQLLPFGKRLERFTGVLIYWILLGVGVRGWWKLRKENQSAALLFVIYAIVITALHLPFTMNTRIRTPFLDPVIAILTGCAFTLPKARRDRSLPQMAGLDH